MTSTTPMVVGLDIGTTLVKAQVMDAEGAAIAMVASAPITMHRPRPDRAEQNPDDIWDRVIEVLREVTENVDAASGRLIGLSLAAQSGSLVAVGSDDHPLGNVITWMDARAENVIDDWRAGGTDRTIRSRSGWSVSPGLGLPLIVWMSDHQPDVRASVERFIGVDSFVMHRLTGEWVTNRSNAGGMQLLDVVSGDWSRELSDLAGIRTEQLAAIRPTGERIGSITHRVSESTGLARGLPVINGGHDQACSALALGVMEPSDLMLASGTAWVLTGVVDSPQAGADFSLSHHVVDGGWTASRFLGGFGGALEALIDSPDHPALSDGNRSLRFADLDRALSATQPSGGPAFFHIDARRQSDCFGQLSVGQAARSIMESAAFEVEIALSELALATRRPSAVTLVGGATSSPVWPQIIADVTTTPVSLGQRESSPAIGAALIAAVGVGLRDHHGLPTPSFRRIEPDPEMADHYTQRLKRYRQSAANLS